MEHQGLPDPHAAGRSSPESPIDTATIIESAADLLYVRGVRRDGQYGQSGGERCVMGAVAEVCGIEAENTSIHGDDSPFLAARRALYFSARIPEHDITGWNDKSETDDEIIDTLRHVAKDLRARAVPS